MTKPDYAKMIDLINVLACDEERDAKETCDKSAEAIRTLLESNKALMRERTNLIETKREQIGRLNTRIAELERERNQLRDKLHCMCGSPIDHSTWEGHTPVSVYDYSLDQERSRAEPAEAKLAEAMKAMKLAEQMMTKDSLCEAERLEEGLSVVRRALGRMSTYPNIIAELAAENERLKQELAEARRLISSTHKRAVTHANCEDEFCAICIGGLFICADCGAVEAEAEERICTGRKEHP